METYTVIPPKVTLLPTTDGQSYVYHYYVPELTWKQRTLTIGAKDVAIPSIPVLKTMGIAKEAKKRVRKKYTKKIPATVAREEEKKNPTPLFPLSPPPLPPSLQQPVPILPTYAKWHAMPYTMFPPDDKRLPS